MKELIQVSGTKAGEKGELLSELLNALFDIYGDADFDYDSPVFVSGGFLAALKSIAPKIQSKVKCIDKRCFRLARDR